MDCSCLRHTELPHTSRLFADFVYHFDRVQSYYEHAPSDFAESAADVRLPADRREALVAALRQINGDSPLLDRLAQPGAVAVVTGQQVGLFSGPAYTIYKALTAVKLAASLTARGIPAVPVFWLATEDHDYAEVSRAWSFDAQHRPLAFDVPPPAITSAPVGGIPIPAPPVGEFRRSLDGFPFADEVASWVEASYQPGATFGGAFRSLLTQLLGSHRLLFVDPMQPAVRELAAPAIRTALAHAPELGRLLLERGNELVAAGYHAQVHVEDHTSLVFLLDGGRRLALKRNGQSYSTGNETFSTEQLIDRAPHLSPNALLRPVVQDSMLPTVAYIGGPAELAYLAQSDVIYRQLLHRMPVALPRAGFTLFDAHAGKLMRRYRLELTDFFHGEEALRERISALLIPPPLAGAMAGAKMETARSLDHLSLELQAFDATLVEALARSRRKIEYQIEKTERKIRRESVRRDERASRDAASLSGLLYPEKHLQERLYSILPFVAKHGPGLVDHIYEALDLNCPDHGLLVL